MRVAETDGDADATSTLVGTRRGKGTMTMFGPASGHRVRTHNKQSAELFLKERRMEAADRQERARRSREFRRDIWRRVRGLFSRRSS